MDPKEWWAQMPKLTKVLFGCSMGLTLAGHFGLVNPYNLVFDPLMIWHKFQIWRLVTCVFFFGKVGFPFLINVYFLYSYSIRLETELFERKPADYCMMLLTVWLTMLIVAYFFSLMIVGPILVMSILYTWCYVNKDAIVSFYFGTSFPAMYLPWALLGFNILLGGTGMMDLMGIFVGHVYFYFKFQYPRDLGGTAFLETPQFLRYYFPDEGAGLSGFGVAPASRTRPGTQAPQRRAWGNGQALGGN